MNKKWEVFAIPFDTTHTWLLNKHYAKRIPSIVYAYGVFVDHVMQGVITYGIPASPSLTMGVCGIEHRDKVGQCDEALNELINEVRNEYLEKPTAFL